MCLIDSARKIRLKSSVCALLANRARFFFVSLWSSLRSVFLYFRRRSAVIKSRRISLIIRSHSN